MTKLLTKQTIQKKENTMTTNTKTYTQIEEENLVKRAIVDRELLDEFDGNIHAVLAADTTGTYLNVQQIKALGDSYRAEQATVNKSDRDGFIELPNHTQSIKKTAFVEYEHNKKNAEYYTHDHSFLLDHINVADEYGRDWIVLDEEIQDFNKLVSKAHNLQLKINKGKDGFMHFPLSFKDAYIGEIRRRVYNAHTSTEVLREYQENGVTDEFGNVLRLTSNSISEVLAEADGETVEYKYKGDCFSIGYEEMLQRKNGSTYTKITPVKVYVANDHIRLVGNEEVCSKLLDELRSELRDVHAIMQEKYINMLEAEIETDKKVKA